MVLQRIIHDQVVDLALVLDTAVEGVLESLGLRLSVLQLLLLVLVRLHIVGAHPLIVWASDEVLRGISLRVVLMKTHHLAVLLLL